MRFFNPDKQALNLQRINLAAATLAFADLLTNPHNTMKKSADIIIHLLTVNAFRPGASVWELKAVGTLNLFFSGKIAVDLLPTSSPKENHQTPGAQEIGVSLVDGTLHIANNAFLTSGAYQKAMRTAREAEEATEKTLSTSFKN